MKKMMIQVLVIFALVLFFANFGLAAGCDIRVLPSANGPMQALVDAGMSVNLLYALRHSDGRAIDPSEHKKLYDPYFCLAEGAKPDSKKTSALLKSADGISQTAVQSAAACSATGCEEKLAAVKAEVSSLQNRLNGKSDELAAADRLIKELKGDGSKTKLKTDVSETDDPVTLDALRYELKKVREQRDQRISRWGLLWVLPAFIVGGGLGLFRNRKALKDSQNEQGFLRRENRKLKSQVSEYELLLVVRDDKSHRTRF